LAQPNRSTAAAYDAAMKSTTMEGCDNEHSHAEALAAHAHSSVMGTPCHTCAGRHTAAGSLLLLPLLLLPLPLLLLPLPLLLLPLPLLLLPLLLLRSAKWFTSAEAGQWGCCCCWCWGGGGGCCCCTNCFTSAGAAAAAGVAAAAAGDLPAPQRPGTAGPAADPHRLRSCTHPMHA
jgi:hypothetical protein